MLVLSLIAGPGLATAQPPDFLKPTQTGPFRVNGLSYVELSITGRQSGYLDPVNLGGSDVVPTIDQIVTEIKATGANLVKINLTIGQLKSVTDAAYDPSVLFPLEGRPSDVIAFGQKLAAQGIRCLMVGRPPSWINAPSPPTAERSWPNISRV